MGADSRLTIITFIIGAVIVVALYLKRKREPPEIKARKTMTMDSLLDLVKHRVADYVKDESLSMVSDEAFNAAWQRRTRFLTALQDCVFGVDSAKLLIQDFIARIIRSELKTEEQVLGVYDFKGGYIEPAIKYEIIMYFYKKQYGKNAMKEMITKYDLARDRFIVEDKTRPTYAILNEDINDIFTLEDFELTYESMTDILAILIYQKYKGFGCIDTLREMNIDGINCGASGSILYNISGNANNKKLMKAPRSVWIQYDGKYIHCRFLDFKTEEEVRRITQLICRWHNPGPLTEKRGFIINTMYDESRVLAVRPPAAEYWAFFIRKFTIGNITLESLLNPQIEVEVPDEMSGEEDASIVSEEVTL